MCAKLIYDGYRPGALASVLSLHADYYHNHWNFGLAFESKVASELADFLSRKNESRDLFLAAYSPTGALLGSIMIDAAAAHNNGAHLR